MIVRTVPKFRLLDLADHACRFGYAPKYCFLTAFGRSRYKTYKTSNTNKDTENCKGSMPSGPFGALAKTWLV